MIIHGTSFYFNGSFCWLNNKCSLWVSDGLRQLMPSNIFNGAIWWWGGRNGQFRQRHLLRNQRVSCGPTHIPLQVLLVLATPTCLWLTCICFKRHVGFCWCNLINFVPRQAPPCLNQHVRHSHKVERLKNVIPGTEVVSKQRKISSSN